MNQELGGRFEALRLLLIHLLNYLFLPELDFPVFDAVYTATPNIAPPLNSSTDVAAANADIKPIILIPPILFYSSIATSAASVVPNPARKYHIFLSLLC